MRISDWSSGVCSSDLLGGFSLGARTSVRAVVAGMRPKRLILGGMGLAGLAGWQRRGEFFQRAIAEYETTKRGDDTWLSVQFMKTMKVDRVAAGHLLDSLTDTARSEEHTSELQSLMRISYAV